MNKTQFVRYLTEKNKKKCEWKLIHSHDRNAESINGAAAKKIKTVELRPDERCT